MKLILGLGETGISIARFLSSKAIEFKIADSRTEPPLIRKYDNEPTPILGDWQKDILIDVDEIYISPGIAKSESIYVWSTELGIPVVSDIELFSRYVRSPVIGITGSNGKSTVTKLIGEMVEQSGYKVAIGGNIGEPALNLISEDIEYYVLELSSYQLDYTNELNLFAGVVLNISPDHLDRYDNFESYIASKLSIYKYCQHSVVNIDELHTNGIDASISFGMGLPNKSTNFGSVVCHDGRYLLNGEAVLMSTDEVLLMGEHNIANVLAAFSLGDLLRLPIESMVDTVKGFNGLEHRLEKVATINNIVYFNDSKATNVISAITAIKALSEKYQDIVLIAGGIAKKEDYSELFKLINEKVSHVVLIGESADYLSTGIEKSKVNFADSMDNAIDMSSKLIESGVVLLSPACASFDMFDNFENRGDSFKDSVKLLKSS
jgi:UDP-N-acetylmuramoylalanine--D-glutamate ligase